MGKDSKGRWLTVGDVAADQERVRTTGTEASKEDLFKEEVYNKVNKHLGLGANATRREIGQIEESPLSSLKMKRPSRQSEGRKSRPLSEDLGLPTLHMRHQQKKKLMDIARTNTRIVKWRLLKILHHVNNRQRLTLSSTEHHENPGLECM